MERKKTNPRVLGLIKSLYQKSVGSKEGLWKELARRLDSPNQNWPAINLSRLNRVTKGGETIAVPGKILGTGAIDHAVSVYSFSASKTAASRISKAGGSCSTIESLLAKGAAKGVRLVR